MARACSASAEGSIAKTARSKITAPSCTGHLPGGEQDALAEQGQAGAAEHLALDHLKSYVESAGVMMFPRCNHGLGRRLERHGDAEGEVAGVRPARASGDVAADLD